MGRDGVNLECGAGNAYTTEGEEDRPAHDAWASMFDEDE